VNGFSIDELEIILECLADLLSDASFLPLLFANFDCDPTKADVVQPLLMYIGTCTRYTIVCEPVELGLLREAGSLCMICFRQLMKSFRERQIKNLQHESLMRDGVSHVHAGAEMASSGITDQQHALEFSREMQNARLSKLILSEAAVRFCRKPKEGLMYLQDEGIMPRPITPLSVATFLRIAPNLPKESAGAFLGELGKDDPPFEADGKLFHREVLDCYVRSFELNGQSVLNCMRIFLSAFRLPGEAQQIDRILVAFSEYCHESCLEGKSGLLENPEITYLLSFSIIMLNTDLHNPNVRADRKMTMEQFVKNNTFYGTELKQTFPLPREFLESVFVSISETQIRTERNDLSASMTPETWMDLQLQAAISPEKGMMFTTFYPPSCIRDAAQWLSFGKEVQADSTVHSVSAGALDSNKVLSSAGKWSTPALKMSAHIYGMHWILDADLLEVLWEDLFAVSISVFLMHRCTVAPSIPTLNLRQGRHSAAGDSEGKDFTGVGRSWRRRQATTRALYHSVDILLELLTIFQGLRMTDAVDVVIMLLADFAGVLKVHQIRILFSIR
jgi:hypothetical protein